MTDAQNPLQGLTEQEVQLSREKNGSNIFQQDEQNGFVVALKELVQEPMFVLLVITATIYFISGKTGDGLFMLFAILLVTTISLYQDSRSRNALAELKKLNQPLAKLIRNGITMAIPIEEIVLGDLMIIEEGVSIPADGKIIKANDFSVNESILTGESLTVYKNEQNETPFVYRGTSVAGGLAVCTVTAIGNQTKLGNIGLRMQELAAEKTPLQMQIAGFVKKMAIIGVVVFLIVWAINFFNTHNWLESLLQSLTLAMSILPEEIPVAFTTFMALGAWRLLKMGIIVKQTHTVEALGSATVICTDKTGTITENKMSLAKLFVLKSGEISNADERGKEGLQELVETAMWASEPIPFDPMEIALHKVYGSLDSVDQRPAYRMVYEYPLSGKPPMMTHVFENSEGNRIIAAKGAPEAMLAVSSISTAEKQQVMHAMEAFAEQGYRVLGVGTAHGQRDHYPAKQQDLVFDFKGLLAFYDPPKKNIAKVFAAFYKAGMQVKILTGDNAATTNTIAEQIGFVGADKTVNGDELMKMNEATMAKAVMEKNVFTRMFPEAKLKIINALKANGQIVAMTGDGVNDGPALRSAHIGIAMGKRGTDLAQKAASLILRDDDLAKMVDAVEMGRKIYTNLKKAIQYIISIHIPIILTVFVPLALGWIYPNIFTPVHVIFLEMIMGPTCSIIYENEPVEKNSMLQKPRPFATTFFNWTELATSLLQGLAITVGTLFVYRYAVNRGYDEASTRTMVFLTLIAANIFLTLVNRSFYYSIITTANYPNKLVPMIIGLTAILCAVILMIKPARIFFSFELISYKQIGISILVGMISVLWYELVKWAKRNKSNG
ncbi:MAG: hypothetical protein RLZZ28_1731 [Bacteroidota bacterium]